MEADLGTFFQVVEEVGTKLTADVTIVDDEVDFEVLFETANIHVGSSHGGDQAIHDDDFTVIEAFAVLEYSNAGFQ